MEKMEYEAPVVEVTMIVEDIVLYSNDDDGWGPLIPLGRSTQF
ncbi:MAG: hypothetical protein ACI3YK_00125 [Eubacteriales bacterium]